MNLERIEEENSIQNAPKFNDTFGKNKILENLENFKKDANWRGRLAENLNNTTSYDGNVVNESLREKELRQKVEDDNITRESTDNLEEIMDYSDINVSNPVYTNLSDEDSDLIDPEEVELIHFNAPDTAPQITTRIPKENVKKVNGNSEPKIYKRKTKKEEGE